MAKAKEKRAALGQWAEYFEGFESWKNQYLIRRNGGLISGICLDETRDPSAYKPTFFFHNLLIPSPVLTLAYAAPYLVRGVYKPVKYGTPVDELVPSFREQVPMLSGEVTMLSFVAHAKAAHQGKFGAQAVYLPHFFRDVITLGVCFGESDYYRRSVHDAASMIGNTNGINMNLIGSVEEWQREIERIVDKDCSRSIDENLQQLQLPQLEDRGLVVERIENYEIVTG